MRTAIPLLTTGAFVSIRAFAQGAHMSLRAGEAGIPPQSPSFETPRHILT